MYYSIVFVALLFVGFQITYIVDSSFMLDFFLNQKIQDQSLLFANNFMIYQTSMLLITVIGCFFMKKKNIIRSIVLSIIVTLLYILLLIAMIILRFDVFLQTLMIFTIGVIFITSILYWYDFVYEKNNISCINIYE